MKAKFIPVALGALLTSNSLQAQNLKPNIVFILADDMGIGDLGCYGQKQIKTPNIDKLAKNGIQFMNHYSGSTVSAPSRCALLTGKHTGHGAIRGNKGEETEYGTFDLSLPNEEVTVAEVLKAKGYTTACVGKWGLGGVGSTGSPDKQGFDYFYGYMGQGAAHTYYPEFLYENNDKVDLKGEYSHYAVMRKGLEFVDKNSEKPFFIYFAVTPPHADLDIPDLGEYENEFDEVPYINNKGKGYKTQLKPRAAYAAMVSEVDKNVGEIVALLQEKGILENTIIVFSSDNGVHDVGGHDPAYFDSNGPFRGNKRDLYEGGIRAPFILSWSKHTPQQRYSFHVSTFWDFLPTVCDIIGSKIPAGINGISYLNEIKGESSKQKQHEYIYHEFHEQGGKQSLINQEGWKLIHLKVNSPNKSYYELFNLNKDPFERCNVVEQYPEIASTLKEQMKKERSENANFQFKK